MNATEAEVGRVIRSDLMHDRHTVTLLVNLLNKRGEKMLKNKKWFWKSQMGKGVGFSALIILLVATMASVGVVEAANSDEGKIAFMSAGNIHIINPDGTDEIRLTEGECPLWFPDGKRIFFERWNRDTLRIELNIINIDGTDKTKIFDGYGYGFILSPDGKKFLFRKIIPGKDWGGGGVNEFVEDSICTINTDGSDLVKLLSQPREGNFYYAGFCFSPDGEKIAYISPPQYDTSSIYIMDSDGTNNAKLLKLREGELCGRLRWSPDGKKLMTYGDNPIFVGVIDSNGTNIIKIADGYNPVWSPDGEKIVYHDNYNLWVMNPDGTGKNKIAERASYLTFYSWSPDSEKIVYGNKYGYGDDSIYIVNADGSGLTRLAYGSNPQWSPVKTSLISFSPSPTSKLTVTPYPASPEDAFNYQGEYTLDASKLMPEEIEALPYAMKYAKEYKVSPCLIMAVIIQESNFQADANGGEDVGYMQVTYDAAKYGGYKGTEEEWGDEDGLDPDQNIEYGTKYLMALNYIFEEGKLLVGDLRATAVPDRTERLKFVLAAYNGGAGRIATAQQLCKEEDDDPEKWNEVKNYLEEAGATAEKAEIIKKYVEQVIEGRDLNRGYEFFLTMRVPAGGASMPEEGVPGFEAVFAFSGILIVAYLLRWKR